MMIKKGFALVEIIVSIAISSVISVVLFTILMQVQKSAQFVASDVSVGIQIITGYERLQKDFTGMFWPQFMPPKIKPAAKSQEAAQDRAGLKSSSQDVNAGESSKMGQGEDFEPYIDISKIIFSENTRFNELEILKECSFITCNPLQVYGETKSRVARVIYSLEPELNSPTGSFSLYRQEGTSLDYLQVKNEATKFVLISGIRSLNLNYFYQELKQDPELIKKQELELDQLNNLDQNYDQDAGQDLAGRVPSYVKLNLSLWNSLEQKDYQDFEFWFYINNLALDEQKKVDESKK